MDERSARFGKLQKLIATGEYRVDSSRVAAAILNQIGWWATDFEPGRTPEPGSGRDLSPGAGRGPTRLAAGPPPA
jgi:hypothetical protein